MDADDLAEFGQRAALVGETLWPSSVVIDGETYACTATDPRLQFDLVDGGEMATGEQIIVRIRKELLPVKPAESTKLLKGSQPWVIRSVTGERGPVWVIRCDR